MNALSKFVVIIMLAAVLGPIAPVGVQKAHAFSVVNFELGSAVEIAKEALQRAAILAAKTAIKSLTRSTVNWINSGFDGSPAYVTDLNNNMRQLSDAIASNFLNQLLNEAQIKSPFLNELVGNIGLAYYAATDGDNFSRQLAYTLTRYSPNDQAFLAGDFSQGGYNAWFATILNCGNNPYCARYGLEEQLANRLRAAGEKRLRELDWGRGFLSWRGDCVRTSGDALIDDRISNAESAKQVSLADKEGCTEYSIKTPGTVIESALIENVNSPLRELQLAKSIDEIAGALASQLIKQALGGGGVRGASAAPSGGTGPRTTNTPSSTIVGLSDAFAQQISSMKEQVTTYQTGWQTIRGVAGQAATACQQNQGTLTTVVQPVVQQGDTALAKASASLSALNAIQQKVVAIRSGARAGANEAGTFAAVQSEYDALLAGNTLPTGEEIRYVVAESFDSAGAEPETVYTLMKRLSQVRVRGVSCIE